MKKVMGEFEVPSAACDFEADHEIAALANTWNCPVLGRDSDFFVMDIKGGYLPLEMLDWMHVRKKGAKTNDARPYKYLSSTKYTLAKFCKHFNVKKELVGLLATVTGNDYVDPTCINQFLMQIYQRPKRGKNSAKKHGHLHSVLDWLADQNTMEECLQNILACIKMGEREKVRIALETSLRMYIPSDHSRLAQYFTDNSLPSSFDAFSGALIPIPHWCLASHRHGYIPNLILNVMCSQRVFTPTQVENHRMPSANEPAKPLRQILYGILSHQHCKRSEGHPVRSKGQKVDPSVTRKGGVKKLTVLEYDRRSWHVKCNEVAPSYDVPNFGPVIPVEDMSKVNQSTRCRLMQSALGVDAAECSALPPCFRFAILVVIYWISHADPKANTKHLRALLLCWVYLLAKQSKPGEKRVDTSGDIVHASPYPQQEVKILLHNFHVNVDPKMKVYPLNMEVAHGFAQMQSCLIAAMHLNAVLDRPYPEPDITSIYSGRLVHCLYGILNGIPGGDSQQQSWLELNLFHGAPTVLALYNAMNRYVMSHIGSESLYVPPPKRKRRGGRGGGRGRGKSRQGREGQMCNQFSGLVVEGDVEEEDE